MKMLSDHMRDISDSWVNILVNVTADSGIVTADSDDRDRGLALRVF